MAKRKRPLRGTLRKLLSMTPREFIEFEAATQADEMCARVIETASKPGVAQLPAFNSVWDRAEGPVVREQVAAQELHMKVIGMPDELPALTGQGDIPHGSAEREAAEARAFALEPALADGGGGEARRHLPGIIDRN